MLHNSNYAQLDTNFEKVSSVPFCVVRMFKRENKDQDVTDIVSYKF